MTFKRNQIFTYKHTEKAGGQFDESIPKNQQK